MHRAPLKGGAVMWWVVAASYARRAIQDRWRAASSLHLIAESTAASADGDPAARNFLGFRNSWSLHEVRLEAGKAEECF
jgi:hypothetical protein